MPPGHLKKREGSMEAHSSEQGWEAGGGEGGVVDSRLVSWGC